MTEETIKSRAPRWMRVVLVLSLALNLLIVGAVVGAVSSGKKGGPRMSDVSFGPYTAALSREDRRALRRAIRDRSDRPNRAAARENFQTFLNVLRTEPLDVAEMTRVFEAQGALAQARQAAGKTALLEHIAEMGAADRAAFADRLEEVLRRGPGKRP
ncbi:periplasmic heavy metal sensor [Cognatishimia sp. MH4019]|uniref:periplasmic heavy metal sensor n=1 Tax=Cognatishimia sp. MH4019 TaxID=2854030 RepID=UPI001CD36014|nr:periplasmic heavy metal sensor [Cognatishimia sp. MH4019]